MFIIVFCLLFLGVLTIWAYFEIMCKYLQDWRLGDEGQRTFTADQRKEARGDIDNNNY